jgi:hypothetical protein
MVLGFGLLAARFAPLLTRAGATTAKTPLSKWGGASTARKTPWSTVGKVGVTGAAVGVGGAGIGSAIGSAQESITKGGGGLLVVGGLAVAVIIIILMLMRRK